jgi:DNA (cytosine-5)-methyltransferase 1
MEKINVDNTKELTVVEWFTGYGGNELGLRRVLPTMRPIAFCERDAFVVANLVSKMEKGLLDAVPIWTDVTTFPIEPFQDRVGLFVASYPCQPFSHAGKRNGKDDDRHLWPDCRRFIQRVRPGMVFLENVEGHISLGLSTVLSDLAEDGYTATWGIFSAAEVGAPHQRKRVFIMAYDRSQRKERLTENDKNPEWAAECRTESGGIGGEDVAHRQREGLQGHAGDVNGAGREPGGADRPVAEGGLPCWPSRPGEAQYGWEPPRVVGNTADERRRWNNIVQKQTGLGTERPGEGHGEDGVSSKTQPPLGGNPDGNIPGLDFARLSGLGDTELAEIREWMVKGTNRTDELRMCGNGVCPPTAERAFRVLYEELRNK